MIQEGSQLNAQIRRQPVALGGSMQHGWQTPLDLPLKTSILSKHVGIWVLMGIREHPENENELFFVRTETPITYRLCDTKRDFKAQFRVTLTYD